MVVLYLIMMMLKSNASYRQVSTNLSVVNYMIILDRIIIQCKSNVGIYIEQLRDPEIPNDEIAK